MSEAPRVRRFQAHFKEALVDRVRKGVEKDLEAMGAPSDDVYALITVVDELCCNILEHSKAHWVELEIEPQGKGVLLTLRDDGAAFDPSPGLKNGARGLDEAGDRRLGLYMVGKLVKGFRYQRLESGINESALSMSWEKPEI